MPDLPSNKSTLARIAPGGTYTGTLESRGDRDWVRMDLKANQWVTVDVGGDSSGGNALFDPYLRVFDPAGKRIAVDDDSGGDLAAQATFRAAKTGAYFIEAASYVDDYRGDYRIDTTVAKPPSVLDALRWGSLVGDDAGNATTVVTVAFVPRGQTRDGYTSEGFNAYEKAQFAKAFAAIANVTALTFDITNSRSADLQLVLDTNEVGGEFYGYFNPPKEFNAGVGVFDGTLWDRRAGGDLERGGSGYVTIVHELLHGLGLAHPHDRGGSSTRMDGVGRAFGDYGTFDLNQGIFTTMSYNSGYFTGSRGSAPNGPSGGYEAGPMALDIAVLQDLYGANTTFRSGNDSYRLRGNDDGSMWRTIWDTDGQDRIVFDGARDAVIDLRAATLTHGPGAGGYVSAAKSISGGFTIAHGVTIENARSGGGDDWISGNGADNKLVSRGGDDRLIGRGGDDTLKGGRGQDVLRGGDGADVLTGGRGADTFDFKVGRVNRDTVLRDTITDFDRGTDTINLRGLDANLNRGGNQAFDFIGRDRFDGKAGELRVVTRDGDRILLGDMDGDGRPDLVLRLLDAGVGVNDIIL